MLSILQIVAVFQGLFLLTVLFVNRRKYKQPALWLLLASIVSVLLFIVGDDENNILSEKVDWFFFDITLFVTFMFLFVKYFINGNDWFQKRDLLFFVPNLAYVINEIYEVSTGTAELFAIQVVELMIELSFFVYLLFTISLLLKKNKRHWMLFFIAPLTLLISSSILNEVLGWLEVPEIALLNDSYFHTFVLLTVAALFYVISLKLVVSPKEVLLSNQRIKYVSSGLKPALVESYKMDILRFMEEERGYKDGSLSLTSLSLHLKIPKQYISEILNLHLETNFQDFVNQYRIEAFTNSLQNDQFNHFSLMGVAQEVGFNSKTAFYSAFKKFKGVTPAEYRRKMRISSENSSL